MSTYREDILNKARELAKQSGEYDEDPTRLSWYDYDVRSEVMALGSKFLRVHLGIYPDGLQRAVIDDEHPRKICIWGRQRGKTVTALLWLLKRALDNPGTNHWYIAPTYRQAKRNTWDKAKAIFPRKILARKPNETELCFELYNGSKIILLGADDPDSLRGPSLKSVVLDEYGTMKASAWDVSVQPTLVATGGHALFIGTPNAIRGPHLKKLWDTAPTRPDAAQWIRWHSRTAEAAHADMATIEEARRGQRAWEFRQEYEASFEEISGLIWPEFHDTYTDDDIKPGLLFRAVQGATQAKLPNGWDCICGVDFGVTDASPTAFLWIGVGPSGQVKVLAEYKAPRQRAAVHALEIKRISDMYGGAECVRFVGDPSGAQMMLEYGAEQIIIEPAENNRDAGIERVGRLMAHNYLYVADCCTMLREELTVYGYDPKSVAPKILKVNDHLCDALRYACMAARPPVALHLPDADRDYTIARWEEDPVFAENWAGHYGMQKGDIDG